MYNKSLCQKNLCDPTDGAAISYIQHTFLLESHQYFFSTQP